MKATLQQRGYETGSVLYMALELSHAKWKLGFSDGEKVRRCTIEACDLAGLHIELVKAREKFGLPVSVAVVSCYEAGRDGFWLHRYLVSLGVDNRVVDSSSIEVNRRARRAKSDRLDLQGLLRLLIRAVGGERGVWREVRVPSVEQEDLRRLHRERERLIKERGMHSARLKSLLATQGLRVRIDEDFGQRLGRLRQWDGRELPGDLVGELEREYARWVLVNEQLKGLEARQRERVEAAEAGALAQVHQLMTLRSVGWQSSWVLVMEFFAWRRFKNRRELASLAGLTPTPYNSGEQVREQGISKAGNRRVRRILIELSWLWLRYQPESHLSRWYQARFGGGSKRLRRIGIVALARRLLIALWRYLETGEVPEGAVLGASR